MDKIFVILGWVAGATLALAIARQLSSQKNMGNFQQA
jgi:thioesterase domain-containing protein